MVWAAAPRSIPFRRHSSPAPAIPRRASAATLLQATKITGSSRRQRRRGDPASSAVDVGFLCFRRGRATAMVAGGGAGA
nr:hypothetical protein Iba_chr07aCG6320 [Ipomoea batatas]